MEARDGVRGEILSEEGVAVVISCRPDGEDVRTVWTHWKTSTKKVREHVDDVILSYHDV